MRQYSCARRIWRTWRYPRFLRCAEGRSADRRKCACGHRPDWRPAAADDRCGRRPQRRIGIEDRRRQALEIRGLLGVDVEMTQLHLGLRPRQGLRAVERVALMMLVDQVEQLVAR